MEDCQGRGQSSAQRRSGAQGGRNCTNQALIHWRPDHKTLQRSKNFKRKEIGAQGEKEYRIKREALRLLEM